MRRVAGPPGRGGAGQGARRSSSFLRKNLPQTTFSWREYPRTVWDTVLRRPSILFAPVLLAIALTIASLVGVCYGANQVGLLSLALLPVGATTTTTTTTTTYVAGLRGGRWLKMWPASSAKLLFACCLRKVQWRERVVCHCQTPTTSIGHALRVCVGGRGMCV